jgi:hypothetical protein
MLARRHMRDGDRQCGESTGGEYVACGLANHTVSRATMRELTLDGRTVSRATMRELTLDGRTVSRATMRELTLGGRELTLGGDSDGTVSSERMFRRIGKAVGPLEVSAGIHSVVKDAHDEHISTFERIKDDVRAMLKTTETFGQLLGASTQAWIRYEIREAGDQFVSIATCLFESKSVD